jgi:putative protease
MEAAVRGAFDKLGPTSLELGRLAFHNPHQLFVPVSRLNQLRRDLTADLEREIGKGQAARVRRTKSETGPRLGTRIATSSAFQWLIKVDQLAALDALAESDLAGVDEIIVDIARDHAALLEQRLDEWSARLGPGRIRLALPPLTRSWEEKGLRHKIDHFRAAGWSKWEAGNLSAWSYLGIDPNQSAPGIDLATDWSVYVINRLAAEQVLAMGAGRFTLSPEDGLANVRSLLAEFGQRAVLIVYQDTPLFLAESCAYANLIGGCPGKANCRFESMEMVSSHGEKVTALDYHCRTIVLNREPFCLSHRLSDLKQAGAVCLRADFIYRPYDPVEVRDLWRLIRAGKPVPHGQAANFDRGIQ